MQSPEPSPAAGKAALRTTLRAARAGLSPVYRARAEGAIARRLDALGELAGAAVIAAYAATPQEVSLDRWIAGRIAAGAAVALPCVVGADLRLVRVRDLGADLAPGWRGLREPTGGPEVDPRDVEVAIVPGVGFDRSGGRLGQGGGHVDRLLARLAPGTPVIGVAFAVQLVARVPVEPHDRPVAAVVTEDGVHRAPARSHP